MEIKVGVLIPNKKSERGALNKEEFNAIFMDKNYLNYTLEEVQSAFWQMLKGYPDEHIRDYWKEFCVYLVEAIGNEQMSRM